MESLNRSALYEAARGNRDGIGESSGTYFLTLCSVSTPVTVPEPKSSALQRFRFFFTRQQEHGRESYWLHFGYFRTPEEARKWREVLCRVYPAAAIRNRAPREARTQDVLTDTQVSSLLSRKSTASAAPSAALGQARKGPTLEDTLSELRDSAWQSLDLNDDTASTTGVRHLRVEVQNERSRSAKPSKPARKA
jgi:hypothetical protein